MDSKWTFAPPNKVIHHSGIIIVVLEGSFQEPYRINVVGGDPMDYMKKVSLIRKGIMFGKNRLIQITQV